MTLIHLWFTAGHLPCLGESHGSLFLTFLFLTCPPLYPHMYGCSQCFRSIPYTAKSHMNGALGPLVSLLLIFYVLCCLPPCDFADQLPANYSISYDSNGVQIHPLNPACVRVPLVSSYIKFCASYSNPPGFGRIFALPVLLFTLPLLPDVYGTSLCDIIVLIAM